MKYRNPEYGILIDTAPWDSFEYWAAMRRGPIWDDEESIYVVYPRRGWGMLVRFEERT